MDTLSLIKEKLGAKIIKIEEKNDKRFYITIEPSDIETAARVLFDDIKLRFIIATGIDRRDGVEIIYHFSDDKNKLSVNLKVLITDKKNPEINTISHIIKGANWIEREMWEMLGVVFKGHPNMKHLLLRDDWPEGNFPLRQGMGNPREKGVK